MINAIQCFLVMFLSFCLFSFLKKNGRNASEENNNLKTVMKTGEIEYTMNLPKTGGKAQQNAASIKKNIPINEWGCLAVFKERYLFFRSKPFNSRS